MIRSTARRLNAGSQIIEPERVALSGAQAVFSVMVPKGFGRIQASADVVIGG